MQGHNIRQWREQKGLSRERLGELCHVSAATVANWELDRNKPHGAAGEHLQRLMSGEVALFPLTPQEERLLDELMRREGFTSRQDFLTAKLVQAITLGEDPAPYQTPETKRKKRTRKG